MLEIEGNGGVSGSFQFLGGSDMVRVLKYFFENYKTKPLTEASLKKSGYYANLDRLMANYAFYSNDITILTYLLREDLDLPNVFYVYMASLYKKNYLTKSTTPVARLPFNRQFLTALLEKAKDITPRMGVKTKLRLEKLEEEIEALLA